MAKDHNSLRTNHLDDFRCRSAIAEELSFLKRQCIIVDSSLRTNNLDDFRHKSAIAKTTDFI